MCSTPKEGSNNVSNAKESLLIPVKLADEVKKNPGAMYMKKILNSNMKLRGSIYENGLDPVERKRLADWGDLSIKDSPNQVGVFDGKTLTVYDEGQVEASFNGVSGKKGFQTKEYQGEKSKGPLPEGLYVARQDRYQEIKDISAWDRIKGGIGRGPWKGNEGSWGQQRVWLEPSADTNLRGRSGFTIHGGAEPDSKGCIDLTGDMPGFADWYKKNGKDLPVVVKYRK